MIMNMLFSLLPMKSPLHQRDSNIQNQKRKTDFNCVAVRILAQVDIQNVYSQIKQLRLELTFCWIRTKTSDGAWAPYQKNIIHGTTS